MSFTYSFRFQKKIQTFSDLKQNTIQIFSHFIVNTPAFAIKMNKGGNPNLNIFNQIPISIKPTS